MKKLFYVTGFCFLCSLFSSAQKVIIKGRVIDENNNQVVELVNVAVLSIDSAFITGCVTNSKGGFVIDKLNTGDYFLKISYIGYRTNHISLFKLSQDLDLGDIFIQSNEVDLDEVVVTSSPIINSRDRFIAYPTEQQKKTSTSGIDIIQALSLPRLYVDVFNDKITVSGGDEVQLRINGIKVTKEEVKGLDPSDIIRVDYIDNPSLRYGGASAVLDYITKRHESGGSISGNLTNSFVKMYGKDQMNFKVNHKKSELSITPIFHYRDYYHIWRKNEENFLYTDNDFYNRLESGLPGKMKLREMWFIGSYNFIEQDKHFFNATAIFYNLNMPNQTYISDLISSDQDAEYIYKMKEFNKEKHRMPYLDLYYQYTINKNQLFLLNLVSTYSYTKNIRDYKESLGDILASDYYSEVEGDRYSIIGEGIYENNLEIGKLLAGIKHSQSYTDNDYFGSIQSDNKLHQAETYLFTEFQGKLKNLNYTLGIKGGRSYFRQEDANDYSSYSFLPTLRLSFNKSDYSIKYSFWAERQLPSLSQLSNVTQIIDSLQIRRGNAGLKPNMTYNNRLSFDYQKGNVSFGLSSFYSYAHKPSMEETILENDVFVRTYDVQRNFQRLNMEGSLSWKLLKNAIQLSINGGFNHFFSNGNAYHHKYTDWYYNANARFAYKKWILNTNIYKERYRFTGETAISGERLHTIALRYNQDKFAIGIGATSPFKSDYKTERINYSKLASIKREEFINDLSRMYYITFSWNISFGRKYESKWRRTYNADEGNDIVKGNK